MCPFCGKTYKRLKSHLPHCKAAATPKTPSTSRDLTATQTSRQLDAGLSKPTAKGKKKIRSTTSPNTIKTDKASAVSSELSSSTQPPLKSANKLSPSQPTTLPLSSSHSSSTIPPSTKKKPKLSDQIKKAHILTSSSTSLSSSPSLSLSPSPILSKPKKKSLRALIEAAKSHQVSKGSASEDLLSVSSPQSPETGPLSSGTRAQSGTQDSVHPVLLSTHKKPKGANKKKVSPSVSKKISDSLDSKETQGNIWVGNDEEKGDLSGNEMSWKAGGGSQKTRITLQDVKTTLDRTKTKGGPSRSSILGQIETSHELSNGTKPRTSPVLTGTQKDIVSSLGMTLSGQQKELTADVNKKSGQVSLTPLTDALLQSKLSSPATALHPSPQVIQTTPPPHTHSGNNGLSSASSSLLTHFSSHKFCPLTAQTRPARMETVKADGFVMKKLQLELREENTFGSESKGQYWTVKCRAGYQISVPFFPLVNVSPQQTAHIEY